MAISEADVQASLRTLNDPNTGRDFVSGKSVRKVQIDGNNVAVDLMLAYPARSQHEVLRKLVAQQLAALPGAGKIAVNISHRDLPRHGPARRQIDTGRQEHHRGLRAARGRRKSTTAVNLALALAARVREVGVLDAPDIEGLRQPTMLGIASRPESRMADPQYHSGPTACGRCRSVSTSMSTSPGVARTDGDSGARALLRDSTGATSIT
jgi:ATP-binding protein involved in chromosome partitioning